MDFPDKWRDLEFDPFAIDLGPDLTLDFVLGYPHAANDVLVCEGRMRGKPIRFVLKYQRSPSAQFANEARILQQIESVIPRAPKLLHAVTDDSAEGRYLVVAFMDGVRLPGDLSGDNWASARQDLGPFLDEWARALSTVHSQHPAAALAPARKQHSLPIVSAENPSREWIEKTLRALESHPAQSKHRVFVHGDMHYANILWDQSQIVGLLDWEFAGLGWREFDVAWAIFPRQTQHFLLEISQIQRFIGAYENTAEIDQECIRWCFALIATHFLSQTSTWKDSDYHERVKRLVESWTKVWS